MAVMSKK